MTTAPKLEPCPAGCPNNPVLIEAPVGHYPHWWRVRCPSCGMQTDRIVSRDGACGCWNTRRAASSTGLREAAQRFHDQVHAIAGEGFLNWRAKLQEHCAEFRVVLSKTGTDEGISVIQHDTENPRVVVSAKRVMLFLREMADAAGFADRAACVVQLGVKQEFIAGNKFHLECPELTIMVSNITDSRKAE